MSEIIKIGRILQLHPWVHHTFCPGTLQLRCMELYDWFESKTAGLVLWGICLGWIQYGNLLWWFLWTELVAWQNAYCIKLEEHVLRWFWVVGIRPQRKLTLTEDTSTEDDKDNEVYHCLQDFSSSSKCVWISPPIQFSSFYRFKQNIQSFLL